MHVEDKEEVSSVPFDWLPPAMAFSRPHDKVLVRVVHEDEFEYFPSSWSDEEIEDWVFREKDRQGRRVLRREIKVYSRTPYQKDALRCR